MALAEKILLSIHLVAGVVWGGSVFMGAFIDWPAAKESVEENKFPFKFVIGQGRRVFYSVYFGIFQLWGSGIGLFIVNPPQNKLENILFFLRVMCLFFMTSFTLYGTFVTWPKIQLSTNREAFRLHRFYNYRAYGTFVFAISASLLTLWYYIYNV